MNFSPLPCNRGRGVGGEGGLRGSRLERASSALLKSATCAMRRATHTLDYVLSRDDVSRLHYRSAGSFPCAKGVWILGRRTFPKCNPGNDLVSDKFVSLGKVQRRVTPRRCHGCVSREDKTHGCRVLRRHR